MKSPNYNYIAWCYDILVKAMYGNRLERAKQAYLPLIEEKNKILIVGGGTGKLINYLDDLKNNVEIDFVEPTPGMISRARKREPLNIWVNYYDMPILDFEGKGYDVIFINFFLDQFTAKEATEIIAHLKAILCAEGMIIFADFVPTNNYWDKCLDWLMFFFFRLLTGSTTSIYPPYNNIFEALGLRRLSTLKVGRNIESSTFTILEQEQN